MGEDRDIARRTEDRGLLERSFELMKGVPLTAAGALLMMTVIGMPLGALGVVAGTRSLRRALL